MWLVRSRDVFVKWDPENHETSGCFVADKDQATFTLELRLS